MKIDIYYYFSACEMRLNVANLLKLKTHKAKNNSHDHSKEIEIVTLYHPCLYGTASKNMILIAKLKFQIIILILRFTN